jgi:hypothetical protein
MPALYFHFQCKGENGWEDMGSGVSSGDNPVSSALADLRVLYGGELPAGSYRCIGTRSGTSRWQTFELDGDGLLVEG